MTTEFTIKGLKDGGIGREGPMYSASLYADGKRVASGYDSGVGGEVVLDWIGRKPNEEPNEVEREFARQAIDRYEMGEDLAKAKADGTKVDYWTPSAMGSFFASLCDAFDNARRLKRMCRTKTLFLLVDDDPAEGYRTIDQKFDAKLAARIRLKYFDKVKTILNEDLA